MAHFLYFMNAACVHCAVQWTTWRNGPNRYYTSSLQNTIVILNKKTAINTCLLFLYGCLHCYSSLTFWAFLFMYSIKRSLRKENVCVMKWQVVGCSKVSTRYNHNNHIHTRIPTYQKYDKLCTVMVKIHFLAQTNNKANEKNHVGKKAYQEKLFWSWLLRIILEKERVKNTAKGRRFSTSKKDGQT